MFVLSAEEVVSLLQLLPLKMMMMMMMMMEVLLLLSTRVPRRRPQLSRVGEFVASVGLGQGRDNCREAVRPIRGLRQVQSSGDIFSAATSRDHPWSVGASARAIAIGEF